MSVLSQNQIQYITSLVQQIEAVNPNKEIRELLFMAQDCIMENASKEDASSREIEMKNLFIFHMFGRLPD